MLRCGRGSVGVPWCSTEQLEESGLPMHLTHLVASRLAGWVLLLNNHSPSGQVFVPSSPSQAYCFCDGHSVLLPYRVRLLDETRWHLLKAH